MVCVVYWLPHQDWHGQRALDSDDQRHTRGAPSSGYRAVWRFSDPHNQLTSLVDGSNFQISGTSIQNSSTSYNKDSGASYGYIKLTTKEQTTLSITASVGSESNYDFGGVYVGTKIYKPTQSQAKSKTTDGSGSYLMSISGSVSSKAYTMTLQANSTYYLNFFYVKDGSGNSNGDRFNVTEIKYRAVV